MTASSVGTHPRVIPTISPTTCLNCGAALQGRFCSECGQRVIPPYPTLREMVGDAWQELSGYDGRFARTFRLLLRRPGALTIEVLEGRRARYVSPVRAYLVASLVYFVISAVAPNVRGPGEAAAPSGNITIDALDPEAAVKALSPEERAELVDKLEEVPSPLRPIARAAVLNPTEFRNRLLANLPRMFFVLVPAFAGIVALFYRKRRFSQHLVFAVHLHAAMFAVLTASEIASFTRSFAVAAVAELAGRFFMIGYAVFAFRRVYGESWPKVLAKSAGIGFVYFIIGIAALFVTVFWIAAADQISFV